MKKILPLIALAFGTSAVAQEIFNYDFEDGQMPANFILQDEDGLSVAPNVDFVDMAWVVGDVSGSTAVSTSWYSPPGKSDDWMIIPDIALPATPSGSLTFLWDALAQDGSYPDGYEVKLSTTGTAVSDFTETLFSIGAENNEWTNRSLTLDDYAGQTVHIAFRNNSNDMFLLLIDNIILKDVGTEPDIALTGVDVYPYHSLTDSVPVVLSLANNSGNTESSVSLIITQNGTEINRTLPVALGALGTEEVTVNLSAAEGLNDVSFEVSVDGETNLDENAGETKIYGIADAPAKKALIEEGTGAWCGWCPRGHVAMEALNNNHKEKTTLVAVHVGDIMEIGVYGTGYSGYASSYPSGLIDRDPFVYDPSEFASSYGKFLDNVSPVSLVGTAQVSNGMLQIQLDATFALDYEGNEVVFNAIVTEDGVTGTGQNYAQVNYYSNETNDIALSGAGHNWQTQSDPVPASEMVYDHVARALGSGFAGAEPTKTTFSKGEVYSHSFSIDVANTPITNTDKLHVVLIASDKSSGRVLNSEYADMITSVSTVDWEGVSVFPNPAHDVLFVDVTETAQLSMLDMHGRQVLSAEVSGKQKVDVSQLATGIYTVVVTTGESSKAMKVMVK